MNDLDKLISALKQMHHAPLPEHPDAGFCMANSKLGEAHSGDFSGHNCGTAACIFGWAKLITGDDVDWFPDDAELSQYIWAIMPGKIPNDPCRFNYIKNPEKFTLTAAIAMLEILRDEGIVDWNRAIDNPWTPNGEPVRDKFDVSKWLTSLTEEFGAPAPLPTAEEPKRSSVK